MIFFMKRSEARDHSFIYQHELNLVKYPLRYFFSPNKSTVSFYSSFSPASLPAFPLRRSSLAAYILVVKGPSSIIAKRYMIETSNDKRNPTGFPNQNDVPKNDIAEPMYMGLSRILNGKQVTLSSNKIPK